MSQQLFIVAAGAVPADATNSHEIAVSKAGFVPEGATTVKAVPVIGDKLQLVYRRADGSPESSPIFSPADIVKASKIVPSAGTAQVTNVTLVVPATQSVGDEWIVKIIDTTLGTRAPQHYNFSVYHTGTDYTVETLTNAFETKINANTELKITADNNGNVLRLTAQNTMFTFRVAVDANAEFSTIDYATPNVPAAGTPEVISALEEYTQSFGRGLTNKTAVPIKQPVSQVNPAASYTLYIFDMLIPTPDYAGIASARTAKYKMYIAEADADDVGAGTNHIGHVLYDLVT